MAVDRTATPATAKTAFCTALMMAGGGAYALEPAQPAPGTNPAADSVQQFLKGELLMEAIGQRNYTSGNKNERDRTNQMWIRARLGAKVELQESVDAQVTLVYDAEGGDESPYDSDTDRGRVAIQDAYALLKSFVRSDVHLRVGRQPVSFNLRTDYGAMIYDSRAHTDVTHYRPLVTSWDGITAFWQSEKFKIIPYAFILDEARESQGTQQSNVSTSGANVLYGATIDWKPDAEGDDRIFITGSFTYEKNAVVNDPLSNAPDVGERLSTYYMGGTIKLRNDIDLYAEGALQEGRINGDNKFKGWGVSAGLDWHVPGPYNALFNFQYDRYSGDDNPNDGDYEAFVNTWEGVSDTLIVEHERYGELSELFVGNLEAYKFKLEYGFLENRMTTKLVAAQYRLVEAYQDDKNFGVEFDLSFDFQYNDYTSISVFGGAFLPDKAYEKAAAAVFGTNTSDDMIQLYGGSLRVLF